MASFPVATVIVSKEHVFSSSLYENSSFKEIKRLFARMGVILPNSRHPEVSTRLKLPTMKSTTTIVGWQRTSSGSASFPLNTGLAQTRHLTLKYLKLNERNPNLSVYLPTSVLV